MRAGCVQFIDVALGAKEVGFNSGRLSSSSTLRGQPPELMAVLPPLGSEVISWGVIGYIVK
jgi:hypothetical protein